MKPPLVSDDIRSEVKRTWANCGRKLLYHRPLRSDLPFQPAIADADKIVIRDGGYDCCKPNVDLDPVLFTVTNQAEVKEVVAHLKFEPVTIMDGVTVPRDGLWLVFIVLLITAAVWISSRYTRLGLATKAAAGNEKGAVLLGYSAGANQSSHRSARTVMVPVLRLWT